MNTITFSALLAIGWGISELLDMLADYRAAKSKKLKQIINKEESYVKDLEILYDDKKGHVVEATVIDRKQYLMHDGFVASDAQEYLDSCQAKVRNAHGTFINYHGQRVRYPDEPHYTNSEFYDHDHFLTLNQKSKKKNHEIHEVIFTDRFSYTSSLNMASRYSDEDLPELENLVKSINLKEKIDKPLEELLTLNTIHFSEEEKEHFFDQIALKLEA